MEDDPRRHLTAAEPTSAPAGYLDVAGLDEVTYRELADRRAWLLGVIGAAGPGADNPGARTAAFVLPAVLTELDVRGKAYAACRDHSYSCSCGFTCTGLAAFDEHMDRFPPEAPGSHAHQEL